MMKVKTLQDLFNSDLKYLYNAEKQISKALPKLAKAASSSELKNILEKHADDNKRHIDRLEKTFDKLGVGSKGEKSKGIEGLIQEGQDIINKSNIVDPNVLDAALIATAQRIQHYEIAAYGTLRTYASLLGHKDVAKLFQQTLDEEKKTDRMLTRVAENTVNVEAL